jgi:hypothetical protein
MNAMKVLQLMRFFGVSAFALALSASLTSACSYLNREGPIVSCATLGNGAENACQEGIIATCEGGSVQYVVCESQSACEALWQVPGQYRCALQDPVDFTTPDSQFGGGSPTSPLSNSGSAAPVQSEVNCDLTSEPCPVASTPADDIEWYTLDEDRAYFSDCSSVWAVSKHGGFPTTLATGTNGCSFSVGNVEIDATDLFFIRDSTVVRLAKAGGEIAPLGTSGAAALTTDRDNVYWIDLFDDSIKSVPKRGGAAQTIASIEITSFRRITARGGFIYWMQPEAIARVPTSGPFPAAAAALPLGIAPDDFAVADSSIFFVSGTEGVVGNLALAGGSWTQLATSESSPDTITTDGSNLYWASFLSVRKMSLAGGTPTTVARLNTQSSIGRIITDATHIYWAEGQTLMRAPK